MNELRLRVGGIELAAAAFPPEANLKWQIEALATPSSDSLDVRIARILESMEQAALPRETRWSLCRLLVMQRRLSSYWEKAPEPMRIAVLKALSQGIPDGQDQSKRLVEVVKTLGIDPAKSCYSEWIEAAVGVLLQADALNSVESYTDHLNKLAALGALCNSTIDEQIWLEWRPYLFKAEVVFRLAEKIDRQHEDNRIPLKEVLAPLWTHLPYGGALTEEESDRLFKALQAKGLEDVDFSRGAFDICCAEWDRKLPAALYSAITAELLHIAASQKTPCFAAWAVPFAGATIRGANFSISAFAESHGEKISAMISSYHSVADQEPSTLLMLMEQAGWTDCQRTQAAASIMKVVDLVCSNWNKTYLQRQGLFISLDALLTIMDESNYLRVVESYSEIMGRWRRVDLGDDDVKMLVKKSAVWNHELQNPYQAALKRYAYRGMPKKYLVKHICEMMDSVKSCRELAGLLGCSLLPTPDQPLGVIPEEIFSKVCGLLKDERLPREEKVDIYNYLCGIEKPELLVHAPAKWQSHLLGNLGKRRALSYRQLLLLYILLSATGGVRLATSKAALVQIQRKQIFMDDYYTRGIQEGVVTNLAAVHIPSLSALQDAHGLVSKDPIERLLLNKQWISALTMMLGAASKKYESELEQSRNWTAEERFVFCAEIERIRDGLNASIEAAELAFKQPVDDPAVVPLAEQVQEMVERAARLPINDAGQQEDETYKSTSVALPERLPVIKFPREKTPTERVQAYKKRKKQFKKRMDRGAASALGQKKWGPSDFPDPT